MGKPRSKSVELIDLRFGFLNTHDIGILCGQPVEKTFARGGANAISIEGNHA